MSRSSICELCASEDGVEVIELPVSECVCKL